MLGFTTLIQVNYYNLSYLDLAIKKERVAREVIYKRYSIHNTNFYNLEYVKNTQ